MKKQIILLFILSKLTLSAQFLPQVGFGTNDAIQKDDAKIKAWATGCEILRGWINITNKSLGKASFGTESNAIGVAGGGSIVSLGDSGVAILTFAKPVKNGIGADFAVFENAFLFENAGLAFIELAFVEVSSDGNNYFRFPSESNTDFSSQLNGFGYLDASKINNLAGKYINNYGTPFDLEELKTVVGLDVDNITHVKIIDVIGIVTGNKSQKDSKNQIINDPFPTPFTTCGFDLDAVGVLNENILNGISDFSYSDDVKIFPSLINKNEIITINTKKNIQKIEFLNLMGFTIPLDLLNKIQNNYQYSINENCTKGMNFIKIYTDNQIVLKKIIIE